jgi:hypothetical protein
MKCVLLPFKAFAVPRLSASPRESIITKSANLQGLRTGENAVVDVRLVLISFNSKILTTRYQRLKFFKNEPAIVNYFEIT